MTARTLMFMGTGSDVGKSLIVAGLCRAFANRGLAVAPFKPQNMSNNAAVTEDGGEIGRAQGLQARAAKLPPTTAMNPVLLKPEAESGAQIVVRGRRRGTATAREYFDLRRQFLPDVLAAFGELAQSADLVLVEGAGSASEVNLRPQDIANFGFARAVGAPVIVIGDIHRGGVIASLVGTLDVLDPGDAALVVATLVNRFRGDPSLFAEGRRIIEEKTARPCFGPVPWFDLARRLPAEDSLALDKGQERREGGLRVAVPRLNRIANFDDLDPLAREPGVALTIVEPGAPVPRDTDLVILPGTKSTRADLDFLRRQGWDIDIRAHVRAGGQVLGICGGFQMLGTTVADPQGLEGAPGETAGLGLLKLVTTLDTEKRLDMPDAIHVATGEPLSGYRMHLGVSEGPALRRPFSRVAGEPEGAVSENGRVTGTYLHGLFAADGFRRAFLAGLGAAPDPALDFEADIEATLDALAAHVEAHLDLGALLALARHPELPA